MFRLTYSPILPSHWAAFCESPCAGALVSFEGRVRNHNGGRPVAALAYEAFESLAVTEGDRILDEACARFHVTAAACVHRLGQLGIGEIAVWVGASAPHRRDAFAACEYIIDELKARVPIWKKEFYMDGASDWVSNAACACGHEASASCST